MKKFLVILMAAVAVLAMSGCKKDDNTAVQEPAQLPEEIAEALTGETTEGVVVGDVLSGTMTDAVLKINDKAVVQQSVNLGSKMLKIELPLSDEKLPDTFFRQVKSVIDKCKLQDNAEYDYFYFSTSKDGAVQIVSTFKRENDSFVLDAVTGIADEYKDAPDRAAKISSIFKKAE